MLTLYSIATDAEVTASLGLALQNLPGSTEDRREEAAAGRSDGEQQSEREQGR